MAAQLAQGSSLTLTDDAVAEILARLPAICIGRFRAVCRAWNAIAAGPSVDRALAERPATVTAIMEDNTDDDALWWLSYPPPNAARFDRFRGRWHPAVHSTPPCPMAVSLGDDMTISAEAFRSGDGVLCTRVFRRRPWRQDATSMVGHMLWNPLTNACAVVSVPSGQGRIIGGYAHPVTGHFHLLHSSDKTVSDDLDLVAPITVLVRRVGDDRTSWREVPLPLPPMVSAGCSKSKTTISMTGERDHCVSLHGKLHWLVQLGGSGKAALLVFDTAREQFRFMVAPERPGLDPTTARLRVVPGGKLCMMAFTNKTPGGMEVWVLDDYSDPWRSWRLRETIELDGTHLSRAASSFVAAAAVEVVEGVNEGEEIFVHYMDHGIEAYNVRSKVWRSLSESRRCATLLMHRESAMQPEISFGKALRGFHRGTASISSSPGWFWRYWYTSADFPLKWSFVEGPKLKIGLKICAMWTKRGN